MALSSLVALGLGAVVAYFAAKPKGKKGAPPSPDVPPGPFPIPPIPVPPPGPGPVPPIPLPGPGATQFADGHPVDANMPAPLVAAHNALLARTDTTPEMVLWVASSMRAAQFPLAADCLEKRAADLQANPSPNPAPPSQGPTEQPPPWWPPGLPWPPPNPAGQSWWPPGVPVPPGWPGAPAQPGQQPGQGGNVTTTVKVGDTAYGYARFYESKGQGPAATNLVILGGLNPAHAAAAWAWHPGQSLILPGAWVAAAGLPPLPTSQYQ